MDDKMRAQGLKAIHKAAVAAEGAGLELEDIRTAGCGAPEAVDKAKELVASALDSLKAAHRTIREAHIVKAEKEQGRSLPFPEGAEGTRPPARASKKKGRGKGAAAGDPDADAAGAGGSGS